MILFVVLIVSSIVAFVAAIFWFIAQPTYEPLIAVAVGIASLVGAYQSRPKKQPQKEKDTSSLLSEEHRKADLRLLYEFWRHINSPRLRSLTTLYEWRVLNYDFFTNTVTAYEQLRARGQEKHFINLELENAFGEFDSLLADYEEQMFIGASLRRIRGEERIIPEYKHREWVSEDEYWNWTRKHFKTIEIGRQVIQQHNKLVDIIKKYLPEFTFPEE